MTNLIVVVGAGSVGVNLAIFLSKLGFEVELIESNSDMLQGSPQVSFVNHGDGFEYYKPRHQRTGQYCIDGSFVKSLIYPVNVFKTNVCDEHNPIRFFVSNDSEYKNGLTLDSFIQNAQRMKEYFTYKFKQISKALNLNDNDLYRILGRNPNSFFHILRNSEYTDIANVAGGCGGSSFGINMPHYYALLKAAIRELKISFHQNTQIESIEKNGSNYLVHASGRTIKASCVLITAGHHIPQLSKKIQDVQLSSTSGMFYLNSMTFIKLPATSNSEKLLRSRHINFTLQAEGGGMFACVVPPTQNEDGFGVLYYPSIKGSQLKSHFFSSNKCEAIPTDWDNLIISGIDKNDTSIQQVFKQACNLYPFLNDYAEVIKAVCRPVFNISTFKSNNGKDRRVREISYSPIMLSQDKKISMWTAPKWTNAELVSLMATDHVCYLLRNEGLPRSEKVGFGPTSLDIAKISQGLNFQNLKMKVEDAVNYATSQGVPSKIVNKDLIQFN